MKNISVVEELKSLPIWAVSMINEWCVERNLECTEEAAQAAMMDLGFLPKENS